MASSARIDELRKKFDENPRRYFAPLANEYRKAGDLEQAIFICQEYLPQQPGHMSGHIVYGQALFELNRNEEAKTVFETALSLDPENLIALRHLGDIARLAGDAGTARIWYQRVLEADPRNEEIAQLMLSLLAPAPVAPTPAASAPAAPQAPAVDHAAPTPLTNPVVTPAVDTGFAVEKSPDSVTMDAPPPPPPTPATSQAADPASYVSRHAPKEEELLDLDSFDLGGVPLSTLRGETPAAPMDFVPPAPADEAPSEGLLDLPASVAPEPLAEHPSDASSASDSFEADPFAIASESQPEIELAQDVSLGLPDDGTSGTFAGTSNEALGGLETFEAGVIAHSDAPTIALETESFFETPPITGSAEHFEPASPIVDSATADAPPLDAANDAFAAESFEEGNWSQPVPEPEPEPAPQSTDREEETAEAFATETMATLYVQQGHLEQAAEVYRKLVDQRPSDARLRDRLLAVEEQMARNAASAVPSLDQSLDEPLDVPLTDTPIAPAPRSYGGPTIRDFLSGILNRRAATPSADVHTSLDDGSGVDLSAPDVSAVDTSPAEASAFDVPDSAEPPVDEPVATPRATPTDTRIVQASGDTVSGSLGALFSGAEAAAADTQAAQTLADAFAPDGPDTAPLQGVPAHRASSELSLNHVFKGGGPRPSGEGDAFSFDRFFANDAAEPPASEQEATPSGGTEAADDIAQFNAWLNGLKKS